MKDIVLATGHTATIREKDELTEGQSRKIEIARSRGAAVFQRLGTKTETGFTIASEEMDKLSDEDFANIRSFEDAAIVALTVALDGEPIGDPTELRSAVFDALAAAVLEAYGGGVVAEGPDEKIDPLVGAVGSTDSSSATPT